MFADREELLVVLAEASFGIAIVPAVRCTHGVLRLLGEELFDYRTFIHVGDEDVLRQALDALGRMQAPLEVVAVRKEDRSPVMEGLDLGPFTVAPEVNRAQIGAVEFGARHVRLARNLRRFRRQGFQVKVYGGENSALILSLYQDKAQHDPTSLFHDRRRVEFMVEAGRLQGSRFEIFTLESAGGLAAAVVTFREANVRRFYTCLFCPRFARLSPALVLIHEVTRRSLESGLDCDYMTGEQGYKLRLATGSVPLYRLRATSEQLTGLERTLASLRPAG